MSDPDGPLRRFILLSFAILVVALVVVVLLLVSWREYRARASRTACDTLTRSLAHCYTDQDCADAESLARDCPR